MCLTYPRNIDKLVKGVISGEEKWNTRGMAQGLFFKIYPFILIFAYACITQPPKHQHTNETFKKLQSLKWKKKKEKTQITDRFSIFGVL